MALELETLAVALVAETDDFKSGLQDADNTAKSWASGLGDSVGGLLKTGMMVGVGAVVAGVASIGVAAFNVSSEVHAAAGDMAASLGLPIEEAEKFAEVAKEVYGNNFADSVTDAADAVANVTKQLQLEAGDPALKTITENAFRLRDAFGVDVADSVSSAKTLMENFGISADQAFDMLAGGYQAGLDRSGDFLDTIGEYSVQFADGGASADEFFSILSSGMQGGMLGTDKAADLFKEFRVRIQDGSKLTRESLLAIGLDADTMSAQLADGSLSAIDAFTMVQRGLAATTDSNVQFQAGVGLLGTQYEDLGNTAAAAINTITFNSAGLGQAVEMLDAQYNTFGDAATGVWRKIVVAVTPLTDALLNMVNAAMPSVMAAFDTVIPVIERVVGAFTHLFERTDKLTTQWEDGSTAWGGFLKKLGMGEETAMAVGWAIAGFAKDVQAALETVKSVAGTALTYVSDMFTSHFGPAVEGGTGILEYFKGWIDENLPRVQQIFQTVLAAIQGFWDSHGETVMTIVNNTFHTIFTVIDTVLKTVMDLITLTLQVLTGDWEGAWDTVLGIVERIWNTIVEVIGTQIDSVILAITSIDWLALGSSIVQGMIDGIVAMSTKLWEAAKQISKDLWTRLTEWWKTGSPSQKAIDELGKPIGEGVGIGIVKGIDDAMNSVDSSMVELLNSMGSHYGQIQAEDGSWVNKSFYAKPKPPSVYDSGMVELLNSMGSHYGQLQAEDGSWVNKSFYDKPPITINIALGGSATEQDGRNVGIGIASELRARGLA